MQEGPERSGDNDEDQSESFAADNEVPQAPSQGFDGSDSSSSDDDEEEKNARDYNDEEDSDADKDYDAAEEDEFGEDDTAGRSLKGKSGVSRSQDSSSVRQRLGQTVQRAEIQVVILLLISVDITSSLVQLFLSCGALPSTTPWERLGRFLEYNMAVTTMVFILEMAMITMAFGVGILTHPGYTLDLAIVVLQVYFSAVYNSSAIRLLGLFRLWRLVRFVDKVLEDERESHAETLFLLEEERSRVEDLLSQLREKDKALKREKSRLKRSQTMLQNYKDDNAWLVDALHIAAESAATGLTGGSSMSIAGAVDRVGSSQPARRKTKIKVKKDGKLVRSGGSHA